MTARRPTQFIWISAGTWRVGEPVAAPRVDERDTAKRSGRNNRFTRRAHSAEVEPELRTPHYPPRHQFNEPPRGPQKLVRHQPPRHQFNEKISAQDTPALAPTPPPMAKKALEREVAFAKLDKEHAKVKYSDRTAIDKEMNATAFENDTPWGRRPERANVGYASAKAAFRR